MKLLKAATFILTTFSSGKKEERHYENGVLNGSAVVFGVDGDKFVFTYVDGRIAGLLLLMSRWKV